MGAPRGVGVRAGPGAGDELDLDAPLPAAPAPSGAVPRARSAGSRRRRPAVRRRWWSAAAVLALAGSGWAAHEAAQPDPAVHRAHAAGPGWTSLAALGDPAQVRRLIAADSAARQRAESDPRLVAARQQDAQCSAAAQALGTAAQEALVECAAQLRVVEDVVFADTYAEAVRQAAALRSQSPSAPGTGTDGEDPGFH